MNICGFFAGVPKDENVKNVSLVLLADAPQDCFEGRAFISEQRESIPQVPSWRVTLELFYMGGSLTPVTPRTCHAVSFKEGDTEAILHREECHLCDLCICLLHFCRTRASPLSFL